MKSIPEDGRLAKIELLLKAKYQDLFTKNPYIGKAIDDFFGTDKCEQYGMSDEKGAFLTNRFVPKSLSFVESLQKMSLNRGTIAVDESHPLRNRPGRTDSSLVMADSGDGTTEAEAAAAAEEEEAGLGHGAGEEEEGGGTRSRIAADPSTDTVAVAEALISTGATLGLPKDMTIGPVRKCSSCLETELFLPCKGVAFKWLFIFVF